MSKNTKIQWCDGTVNPVMGCKGCELWPSPGQLVTAISIAMGMPSQNEAVKDRLKGMLPTDVYHQRKQLAREFALKSSTPQQTEIETAIAATYRCYAGILHLRHGRDDSNPKKRTNPGYARKFEAPSLFAGRMAEATGWSDLRGHARPEKPWIIGLPRLIFVSDMADALSRGVTFEYLQTEIISNAASERGRRHIWLWLTKRPHRMAEFSEWLAARNFVWPDNLMAMTSITSADKIHRIAQLRKVRCKLRGLSVEPLRTPVTLPLDGIDWAIVGGESGSYAYPFQLEWARDIIQQCRIVGTAPFVKQLGSAPFEGSQPFDLNDSHGGDWSEWPYDLRVREFPAFQSVQNLPPIVPNGDANTERYVKGRQIFVR